MTDDVATARKVTAATMRAAPRFVDGAYKRPGVHDEFATWLNLRIYRSLRQKEPWLTEGRSTERRPSSKRP
jgi:hypothetical protein